MEFAAFLLVAIMLSCGAYLVLDRSLLRVVLGVGLISNGTNLAILTAGGLTEGGPPIAADHAEAAAHAAHGVAAAAAMVDPLPQALILTAIVIGFGVTALLLALSFRTYEAYSSDDLEQLHGRLYDE